MRRAARLVLLSLAIPVLGACAPLTLPKGPPAAKVPEMRLMAMTWDRVPGWEHDAVGDAIRPFLRSCNALAAKPDYHRMGVAGEAAKWRHVCAAAATLNPADHAGVRHFFRTWFVPYLVTEDGDDTGLFTGYYEPLLRGSLTRKGPYQYPLYSRPADLVTVDLGRFDEDMKGERIAGRVVGGRLEPYDTRAEIEKGSLAGKDFEMVWVDSPVDAFFLHVQGSGRVRLDTGEELRLGWDGHNGHPYVAIGKALVASGAVAREDVSMQAIRAWMARHPQGGRNLMASNPSFVFFRRLIGEGPIGAQGVPVTPGRSIAVDRRHIPLGVPLWLDTTDPTEPGRRIRRMVIAQDTGGAIKGIVRGDYFWGHGPTAEAKAGRMKQRGRYFLMLPRSLAR